ncbi:MAG: hypothetical protein IMW90_19460 [Thermogemmatispora sp.]|uniref:hypothetical protein n=1 Tax=Thermogemmatispora sp. TaxID=1968838 RepID=UPI001A052BB6|nr:hypothetical protein [Thermogemmatispora sp.]MBE3567902.1 hypothetical protein [Thermogemmatispora sp.]
MSLERSWLADRVRAQEHAIAVLSADVRGLAADMQVSFRQLAEYQLRSERQSEARFQHLEALVVATRDEVRVVQERTTLLEMRTGSLENRMAGLEGRMVGLEGRMEKVEGRLEALEGRVERLEGRMEKVEGRLEALEERVVSIEEKMVTKEDMAALEARIMEALAQITTLLNARQGGQAN